MRLHLYSWAVFLSNKHYTLCTLALYLSLITRTVFTQFCGENCFWESGDFIFILKGKGKEILCLPLMKIIIRMFFFSNIFLSHVHHRKDSTAKLHSVIVNCSFKLGTVTVYHLMLCKCFRAMSKTGLFTALMQAEVLLVFCSLSHIGSLSKKKRMALFSVSCICLVCILQIKLFNYLWMYRRSRNGCRLSPSSITIITQ